MRNRRIKFNCDVGEGIGNEEVLMPFLSFCSIACGGHAGDEMMMDSVVKLAKSNDVLIGAHPSYPDRINFGRKEMKISINQLNDSINDQIQKLQFVSWVNDYPISYIKFHGALYNKAMNDSQLATDLVGFISEKYPQLSLFVLPNSDLEKIAVAKGINCLREGFADRSYQKDGSLTPRSNPGAVLSTVSDVWAQIRFYLDYSTLPNIESTENLELDTFCVHGDHPNTATILREISTLLNEYPS